MTLVLALLVVLIAELGVVGQTDWFAKFQRIELGLSTRNQVEALFGHPKIKSEAAGFETRRISYQIRFGQMDVSYAIGKCVNRDRGFDVAKDVAVTTTIYLSKPIKFKRLKIDASKYIKQATDDLPNLFTYSNPDLTEYFNGTNTELRHFTRGLGNLSALRCAER